MILKNKKISRAYEKLIDEYLQFIENECEEDDEYKNKIIEKFLNIEYE